MAIYRWRQFRIAFIPANRASSIVLKLPTRLSLSKPLLNRLRHRIGGRSRCGGRATKEFFCLRGYMKSGTNWVCNLLNLHPEICCVGEFHWHRLIESLQFNFRSIQRIGNNPKLQHQIRKHFERAIQDSLLEAAAPDVRLVGDRTPAPIEPVIFRRAPHICVIRDGRDVLISRVFHLLNRTDNPQVNRTVRRIPQLQRLRSKLQADRHHFRKHPTDLLNCERVVRESARAWAQIVRQDQQTIQRMPSLPVHLVRYEDLHQDTARQRDEMYRFLNVDPRLARPLNPLTEPGFSKPSPQDFYRSGQIGDWTNYMTPSAKAWFNDEAGDMLVQLGYAPNFNW